MKLPENEELTADPATLVAASLIVAKTLEALKLRHLFQKKNFYTSIVVYECGSLEGIITLHDIMDKIIGEMPEQGEDSEPDIFMRDDNSFLSLASVDYICVKPDRRHDTPSYRHKVYQGRTKDHFRSYQLPGSSPLAAVLVGYNIITAYGDNGEPLRLLNDSV